MVTSTSYSEVFEVLRLMGEENVKKIPLNILEKIETSRDRNYTVKIDVNIPVNEQISKNALAVLAWLNLEYLSTLEEKAVLTDIYKLNDKKTNNSLKNCNFKYENKVIVEKQLTIIEFKNNLFNKVINKIKNIFLHN